MTPPVARLLDITRLINRAGLHPTGVDRVEVAYLRALMASSIPFFAIARTALGFVLIDNDGAKRIGQALDDGDWGQPDLISRLNPKLERPRRLGQSFARRIACVRSTHNGLAKMLAKHLPSGFSYFNVGHSNLTPAMFAAIGPAKKVILIHDTIPLDHPETQGAGAVQAFANKLKLVSIHADVVICTSAQCQTDVTRHMTAFGRVPAITMAHLGVDIATPDTSMVTPDIPYFVTVGTIEPRKNHAMLLDIWADWPDAPPLVICGKRGWKNADVFARLDQKPAHIIEHNDLTDGQIAALVQGARAMLFPSNAEGFGLPPVEALALGTRVVCANLPVYWGTIGKQSVYVDANDRYLWEKTIKNLAGLQNLDPIPPFSPPTWAAHFKTVLSLV